LSRRRPNRSLQCPSCDPRTTNLARFSCPQVLFVNAASFFWSAFISAAANKKPAPAPLELPDAAAEGPSSTPANATAAAEGAAAVERLRGSLHSGGGLMTTVHTEGAKRAAAEQGMRSTVAAAQPRRAEDSAGKGESVLPLPIDAGAPPRATRLYGEASAAGEGKGKVEEAEEHPHRRWERLQELRERDAQAEEKTGYGHVPHY
jgi:hypothetical protein